MCCRLRGPPDRAVLDRTVSAAWTTRRFPSSITWNDPAVTIPAGSVIANGMLLIVADCNPDHCRVAQLDSGDLPHSETPCLPFVTTAKPVGAAVSAALACRHTSLDLIASVAQKEFAIPILTVV